MPPRTSAIIGFVRTAAYRLVNWGEAQAPADDPKAIEERLAALDEPFRSRLLTMYRGEPQIGSDDQPHRIDRKTRISPSQGMWLYELCVAFKPRATLEIGMAYGYSTLYFLAAIARNGAGRHTAIDPFQNTTWHGIGWTHARSVAPARDSGCVVVLIEDRSDRAAADLARSGFTFDVVFVDGNHRFDDVLVDFYLYAPLCTVGGYIIFDDMWMSSIQTVAAFVRANRKDFAEVRTDEPNVCVFQKVSEDTRDWKHFRTFAVSPSASLI